MQKREIERRLRQRLGLVRKQASGWDRAVDNWSVQELRWTQRQNEELETYFTCSGKPLGVFTQGSEMI